jgi:hypothetical protein
MGLSTLGFGHALVPGEIAVGAYVSEAARDKFACDFRCLPGAVLKQEPAVTLEVIRGFLDDGAEASHCIVPRSEGAARLVTKGRVLHRRVVRSYVGRIAQNEIEGPPGEGLEPASVQELHAFQIE